MELKLLVYCVVLGVFYDWCHGLSCINCGQEIYGLTGENGTIDCQTDEVLARINSTSLLCDGICFTKLSYMDTNPTVMSCREQPVQLKHNSVSKYCRANHLYITCKDQDNCNLEHLTYAPTPVFDLVVNDTAHNNAYISFKTDCQTYRYLLLLTTLPDDPTQVLSSTLDNILNMQLFELSADDLTLLEFEARFWQYEYQLADLTPNTRYSVKLYSKFREIQSELAEEIEFRTLEQPLQPYPESTDFDYVNSTGPIDYSSGVLEDATTGIYDTEHTAGTRTEPNVAAPVEDEADEKILSGVVADEKSVPANASNFCGFCVLSISFIFMLY